MQERIADVDDDVDETKYQEKYDNVEIENVMTRFEVAEVAKNENQRRQKTRLCCQSWLKYFVGRRNPRSSDQSLKQSHVKVSSSFQSADGEYYHVRLRIGSQGKRHSAIDFIRSVDFLQAGDDHANWQKLVEFVGYVKGRVIHGVPDDRGGQ